MNIENIAIVRATNVIPFDGIVYPLSEVPYLRKEKGTRFAFAMYDLLQRQGRLLEIDWSKLDEMEDIDKENIRISLEYVPYTSDYNSMVLWSLNGLVPDDMNNTFSNKTCAIIDSLAEQIEESEVISLMPTDTAIKGKVKLSKQACILISKERYESLSQEEKDKLDRLDLKITIFEGTLEEAINEELRENGRYTAETLSLRREDKGYLQSETSDEVIQTINNIASKRKIAQVLHFNVITGKNDEVEKLDKVKNEMKNFHIVTDFYKQTFLKYLFSRMEIDDNVKRNAINSPEVDIYMKALSAEIERIGIDEYKRHLELYNKALEQLRDDGKLPTPQQIIDAKAENREINLNALIDEIIEKPKKITMQGLVGNALANQSISTEDLKAAEEQARINQNDNGKEVKIDD